MKKKIYSSVSIIAGSAACFAGLAGNAHAIAIPLPDDFDKRTISWTSAHDPSEGSQDPAAPTGHSSSWSELRHEGVGEGDVRGPGNSDSQNSHNEGHGSGTRSTPSPGQHNPTTSVPDGGATVTMLGGALCGLGLLARKRKA